MNIDYIILHKVVKQIRSDLARLNEQMQNFRSALPYFNNINIVPIIARTYIRVRTSVFKCVFIARNIAKGTSNLPSLAYT